MGDSGSIVGDLFIHLMEWLILWPWISWYPVYMGVAVWGLIHSLWTGSIFGGHEYHVTIYYVIFFTLPNWSIFLAKCLYFRWISRNHSNKKRLMVTDYYVGTHMETLCFPYLLLKKQTNDILLLNTPIQGDVTDPKISKSYPTQWQGLRGAMK